MIELISVAIISFAVGYYVCYKYNDAIDKAFRDIGNK